MLPANQVNQDFTGEEHHRTDTKESILTDQWKELKSMVLKHCFKAF